MNRKALPVCRSTLRRRTVKDVEKRLQQIRDDYKEWTDFHLMESDFGRDSGEFLEKDTNCSFISACAPLDPVVYFAESSKEVNADISERLVVGDCDDHAQSSDSEHSDEDVFETFSLSDNIDWDTYDVRILKSCDQYFEARQHLNKSLSCHTSDLQTEEEEEDVRPKRKPKAIHFFGDSDDDSEEDHPRKKYRSRPKPSLHPPAPAVPPPPPAPAVPPPPCHMASNSSIIYPPSTPPLQMECRRPAEQTPNTPNLQGRRFNSSTLPCSATEVHILSLLEHLKNQQEQILAKLNYLSSRQDATPQQMEVEVPVQFPLTSMEEVDSFENWLRDPAQSQLKQRLISSLAAIGGQDTKRITWNILAHIFHYDVGKMINWKGVNGKKSFNQMSSKTLLLHSVRMSSPVLPLTMTYVNTQSGGSTWQQIGMAQGDVMDTKVNLLTRTHLFKFLMIRKSTSLQVFKDPFLDPVA